MSNRVPSVNRALKLLEIFAEEKRDLSNADIAQLLGIAESSSHDLVNALCDKGYLYRLRQSKRFYPTGRLLAVARSISKNDPVYNITSDAVKALQESTRETALAGRIENGVVSILAVASAGHALRYVCNIGDKLSLHVSAMGKALLTLMPNEEAEKVLELRPMRVLGPNSLTDLGQLERQIDQARKDGWIWTEDEGGEGLSALAVAGYINEQPISLCVTGPTARLKSGKENALAVLKKLGAETFDKENAATFATES